MAEAMERRDIHSHWTAKAALVLAMTLALPIPLFAQASPSPGSPPESVGTFQLPPGKAPPPPPAAGPVDPELPAPAPVQAIPPPAAQPDPTPPLLAPQPSPPALAPIAGRAISSTRKRERPESSAGRARLACTGALHPGARNHNRRDRLQPCRLIAANPSRGCTGSRFAPLPSLALVARGRSAAGAAVGGHRHHPAPKAAFGRD